MSATRGEYVVTESSAASVEPTPLVSNQSSTDPRPPDNDSAGQRILIVDDNVIVAKALGQLVKSSGWTPLVFNSAALALKYVEQREALPIAAVVDIHLPDLNGLVLSQKLRDMLGPTPPIVILSGDTSSETIRSLSHVGATYFFSKPVNAKHLIQKLRSLLDGTDA